MTNYMRVNFFIRNESTIIYFKFTVPHTFYIVLISLIILVTKVQSLNQGNISVYFRDQRSETGIAETFM